MTSILNSSCSGIWYSNSYFIYLLLTPIGQTKFPRCKLSFTSYIIIPKHLNDAYCCNIHFFERACLDYLVGLFTSWLWTVENRTRLYHNPYLLALFCPDVEFIEKLSPDRLGQRFSKEFSRIVEYLRPGLVLVVLLLSSLFFNIIIDLFGQETNVDVELYQVSKI